MKIEIELADNQKIEFGKDVLKVSAEKNDPDLLNAKAEAFDKIIKIFGIECDANYKSDYYVVRTDGKFSKQINQETYNFLFKVILASKSNATK